MARNDPTETGGLFIGRRPGTAPLHFRGVPVPGSTARRRIDATVSLLVLVTEGALCLSLWGPQPAAWLWVGSQVDYRSGSMFLGILVAFAGVLMTSMLTLAVAARLDGLWRITRRAAGHDQRDGALARLFGATAIVALIVFGVWLVLIQGPAPSLAPR